MLYNEWYLNKIWIITIVFFLGCQNNHKVEVSRSEQLSHEENSFPQFQSCEVCGNCESLNKEFSVSSTLDVINYIDTVRYMSSICLSELVTHLYDETGIPATVVFGMSGCYYEDGISKEQDILKWRNALSSDNNL